MSTAAWSGRFWHSSGERHENPRGVPCVVMDRIDRLQGILRKLNRQRFSGLRIGLVKRCTGAGDRDADLVAPVEDLADPANVERELRRLAGSEQRFVIEAFAVAGPPGIVADQDRTAVMIDIADANQE